MKKVLGDNNLKYKNKSPWIHQLNKIRKPKDILDIDESSDMVVVGGGIAGVSSAYFILKNTKKSVILVESNKIAHGATGHNAGQVVSYFEKPFFKIVEEYGLEMAARGQQEVLSGWELLEDIYKDAKLDAPFSQFIGYGGCSTLNQLIEHLKNKSLRAKAKINLDRIFVSEDAPFVAKIPKKYYSFYNLIPHKKILELLETKDKSYHVALASKKGCLNSALFCEELVSYLLYAYKKRFKLFEFTPVKKINLFQDRVVINTDKGHNIACKKVVLCTNGFENLIIVNHNGKDINGSYHDSIYGVVGYMAAYLTNQNGLKSNAISYFPVKDYDENDPYFYLTRREFPIGKKNKLLFSIGGPETPLDEEKEYERTRPYFYKRQKEIDDFIKKTVINLPKKINYKFRWHGLMGYTKSRLRYIGPHPLNDNLLYNIGCNGVGILPSIYGGYKIAKFMANIKMPKSIFDVRLE